GASGWSSGKVGWLWRTRTLGADIKATCQHVGGKPGSAGPHASCGVCLPHLATFRHGKQPGNCCQRPNKGRLGSGWDDCGGLLLLPSPLGERGGGEGSSLHLPLTPNPSPPR